MNPHRLTLRQRFALHCAATDTAKSGATRAADAARRSGMDWDTEQMRAALEALRRRGLVAKPTPGHYVITDAGVRANNPAALASLPTLSETENRK